MSRKHEQVNEKRKGMKIVGIVLIILLIIILGVGAGSYWYVNDKLGKMQHVTINEEELKIDEQVEENLSEYRNIAIFALDSRANEYGVGNRSDGIIVVSINNKTKEVKLLSVYRDTYLQIEGHGLDKITHAYAYGGAPLAISTLNSNLDLNIKEFVAVNFDAVAEGVNALGGIELDIDKEEMKIMNREYIDYTSQYTGLKSSHISKTGMQLVDGVQAVSYCRVRYTEGGDYKRTERMREVITAMADKLKTKSVGEINNFLDIVLPKVYTNISSSSIISMAPSALGYKISGSVGWPYEVRGYTGAAWYAAPVNLEENVKKLHQEVFNEENYEPTETVKEISNKIIKKTGFSK